ncbi:MAG TPA: ribosomal-processing cysteine protease Prp [Clostridiales bacterium]|nr:ribosomal-processing cysteine protease Prp [Clostridiales bacterium]
MIKVKVLMSQDNRVKELKVTGHADYSEYGDDIVCSAVSALTQTALLGLLNVAQVDMKYCIKKGYLSFSIPEIEDRDKKLKAWAIMDTMIIGLKNLAKNYSPYIKIVVKREV